MCVLLRVTWLIMYLLVNSPWPNGIRDITGCSPLVCFGRWRDIFHSLTSQHLPSQKDLIINEEKKTESLLFGTKSFSFSPLFFVRKQAGYELIDKKREK